MSLRRILLTGDDGYQSIGTRLLIHALKDKYDLTIAGTVTQQSGVGGGVSLSAGFNWGVTEVDGVKAFWVEGSPVDAMELMSSYDQKPFDLTITGLNWGANIGSAVYGSGTINAAIGAVMRNMTQQAIAVSWDLPPEFYLMHHNVKHSLEEYFEYPGKALTQLLELSIENRLWGAQMLNINFPHSPTNTVKVTKLMQNVRKIYQSDQKVTGKEGHYMYKGRRIFSTTADPMYDVRALSDGHISISPCTIDMLDTSTYQKIHQMQINLK